MEIVKKLIFQGRSDDETIYHLKRELGDVLWYVMQCLIALDTPMEEIVEMNIEKLKKVTQVVSFSLVLRESSGGWPVKFPNFTKESCGPCGLVKKYFRSINDPRVSVIEDVHLDDFSDEPISEENLGLS